MSGQERMMMELLLHLIVMNGQMILRLLDSLAQILLQPLIGLIVQVLVAMWSLRFTALNSKEEIKK